MLKSHSPADKATLSELDDFTNRTLPRSYLDFLAHSDGGEGEIPIDPYYVGLLTAREVIDYNRANEFIPSGLIVIGNNAGGELIVFDMRKPGPYVSSIPAIGCELELLMLVAYTFDDLLQLFDAPAGPLSELDLALEQQAPCLNAAAVIDGEFWTQEQLAERQAYFETSKYLPDFDAVGRADSGIIAIRKSDNSIWLAPSLGIRYLKAKRLADTLDQLHEYIAEYKRIWQPHKWRYYDK